MAKFKDGFLGGFNGSVGPVIGYRWNGIWCMRARPQHVHNPRTEAQQRHRNLFRAEVQQAAAMRWALKTTFTLQAREQGMTAYNLFVSLNCKAFSLSDGQLNVGWSSLRLSCGSVAPVAAKQCHRRDDNTLSVSFEKSPLRQEASAYDSVYLYVYCPSTRSEYLCAPVYRRHKRVSVALPDEMEGQALQLYLMVKDEDDRWSETAYAGNGESLEDMDASDDNIRSLSDVNQADASIRSGEENVEHNIYNKVTYENTTSGGLPRRGV